MAILKREKANERVMSDATKAAIGANRKYVDLKFTIVGKEEDVEKFIISTTKFNTLGLSEKGFQEMYDDGKDEAGNEVGEKAVYLAVANDSASTFMKKSNKGKKGRNFGSTILRDDLISAGLIPAKDSAEYAKGLKVKFDLVEAELEAVGIEAGNEDGIEKVYKVVLSADQSEDDDEGTEVDSDVASEVTDSAKPSKASKKVVEDEEFA